MLRTDALRYRRVMEVAARPTTGGLFRSRVDELLVAAAIRVLTGRRRRPARWRPHSDECLDEFWSHVGRDRDQRGDEGQCDEVLRLPGQR